MTGEAIEGDVFALFDDNLSAQGGGLLYEKPHAVFICHEAGEVLPTLARMEAAQQAGAHLAGFVSYEAAAAFGLPVKAAGKDSEPCLAFAAFPPPRALSGDEVDAFLAERFGPHAGMLCHVSPDMDRTAYGGAAAQVDEHLRAGNTYQVNLSYRKNFDFGGCPFRFYSLLRKRQPVAYGAFLNFPAIQVLSRSPELFFEKRDERFITKPMKGTAARGATPEADRAAANALGADEKTRAENSIIVDLLRNDVARIARPATVTVEAAHKLETYPTLHQLTSTIAAEVEPDLSLSDVLAGLFPCGSITGAPKRRTMQIIAEQERSPRGVYTGTIGRVSPDNAMTFSVGIRTAVLTGHSGRLGLGSGLVIDSDSADEWAECELKGRFALEPDPQIRALECFTFEPDTGCRHVERHLARLAVTCRALGYTMDLDRVRADIQAVCAGLAASAKIRVEVGATGTLQVEAGPLNPWAGPAKQVILSPERTRSQDPVYRYKTTNRALYDREFARARAMPGVYDVLFLNEHAHLTEAATHSVVLDMGGWYMTPALECGVLDGVGRALFLEAHAGKTVERSVTLDDVLAARRILLVSSMRGVNEVTLAEPVRRAA